LRWIEPFYGEEKEEGGRGVRYGGFESEMNA
jgi:hypothetical protein